MTATTSISQSTLPSGSATVVTGPVMQLGNLVKTSGSAGGVEAGLGGVRRVVQRDREHLPRASAPADRAARGVTVVRRRPVGASAPRRARRPSARARPTASDGQRAAGRVARRRARGRRRTRTNATVDGSEPHRPPVSRSRSRGRSCTARCRGPRSTARRGCAARRCPRSRPRSGRRAAGRSRTGSAGPRRRRRSCRW